MSFGGRGRGKPAFTVSGLDSIDSLINDLHTRTRRAILTEAATFYKNYATMTEAAKKTTKEMPSIIDKHMNELLSRHKTSTG